jgi:hypothetical protein
MAIHFDGLRSGRLGEGWESPPRTAAMIIHRMPSIFEAAVWLDVVVVLAATAHGAHSVANTTLSSPFTDGLRSVG